MKNKSTILRKRHYPTREAALNAMREHFGEDYDRFFTWMNIWYKPERKGDKFFIGSAGEWCDNEIRWAN